MTLDLTWGLLGDKLIHIDDVDNGLSCGCRCPECDGILVAKQGTGLRRPHFAHHVDSTQTCNSAQGSALHRIAKEILLSSDRINLPEARHAETHELIDAAGYQVYTNPRAEVREGELRPDVLIDVEWGCLRLEIFVSHRVEHRRLRKIQQANNPTVEITIGNGANFTRNHVEQAVLHEIENKRWIHKRKYTPRQRVKASPPRLPVEPPNLIPSIAHCRICGGEKNWAVFTPSTGIGVCNDCLPIHNSSRL